MFNLHSIQSALTELNLDAWLLYDFRGSNVLARRVLDLAPDQMGSRRFFYLIPRSGEPLKLVHRIESGALDHLPGSKTVYLQWQALEAGIAKLLAGHRRVAMEVTGGAAVDFVARE